MCSAQCAARLPTRYFLNRRPPRPTRRRATASPLFAMPAPEFSTAFCSRPLQLLSIAAANSFSRFLELPIPGNPHPAARVASSSDPPRNSPIPALRQLPHKLTSRHAKTLLHSRLFPKLPELILQFHESDHADAATPASVFSSPYFPGTAVTYLALVMAIYRMNLLARSCSPPPPHSEPTKFVSSPRPPKPATVGPANRTHPRTRRFPGVPWPPPVKKNSGWFAQKIPNRTTPRSTREELPRPKSHPIPQYRWIPTPLECAPGSLPGRAQNQRNSGQTRRVEEGAIMFAFCSPKRISLRPPFVNPSFNFLNFH